jgi:pyruvate dehydrogenase (quinone)
MADRVGDRIVRRLREWGVERVYGYPGDGINGILAGLSRASNEPFFVQSRHEEMAAFMACAHAKWTGEVGVCLATSGPGAIHLLNGLYDAKLDHAPVVAIVGQQARTALGGAYQQEVDLTTLFKDVASDFVTMVTVAEQIPAVIDRAFRVALSQRSVTCVIVPADLQEQDYTAPEHAFKMVPSSLGFAAPEVRAPEAEIDRAAEVLNAGERVAILVGQGARNAAREVEQVADVLGAGVAKALLGKDVLPDDLPFVTGSIGLLGTRPSYDLMMGCDTLLMVGSSFPYSQFLPEYAQARGVQIDIDGRLIGLRYPMEVNVVGDSGDTLRRLLPKLHRKADRSWRDKLEGEIRDWWQVVEARAMTDADPVNPQRVLWELSPLLPDGAIVSADSGSVVNWYARDVKLRRGMRGSLSGTLATMGPAVPYAVAAKFCHPGRVALALTGDGTMQMNGLNELITIAKYWQGWTDPRLVVLVLNNSDLNQVTWEMRAMAEIPKFEASQTLPAFSYAGYADSLGLRGIRVEKPEEITVAWTEAFAADRPVVIDAVTDPEVPPIPPHVEWSEARSFMKAVLKGDPGSRQIIRQGFRGKLQEFLPHRD